MTRSVRFSGWTKSQFCFLLCQSSYGFPYKSSCCIFHQSLGLSFIFYPFPSFVYSSSTTLNHTTIVWPLWFGVLWELYFPIYCFISISVFINSTLNISFYHLFFIYTPLFLKYILYFTQKIYLQIYQTILVSFIRLDPPWVEIFWYFSLQLLQLQPEDERSTCPSN